MGRLFAVTIAIIAILSAVPIVMNYWGPPPDISTHGHAIDDQMHETMWEAGLSFLASQLILALFIWQYAGRGKTDKVKNFPGGAKGLVIAALVFVGTEILVSGGVSGFFLAQPSIDIYLQPLLMLMLALLQASIAVMYFMHLAQERQVLVLALIPYTIFVLFMMNMIWSDSFRALRLRPQ